MSYLFQNFSIQNLQQRDFIKNQGNAGCKHLMNGCDLDILNQQGILSDPAIRRRRKQKRCKRKHSPLLSNIWSLDNKLDELHLLKETHREWKDCVFAFTETSLQDNIPDVAIQLEGMMAFWADRDAARDWCVNATLVS